MGATETAGSAILESFSIVPKFGPVPLPEYSQDVRTARHVGLLVEWDTRQAPPIEFSLECLGSGSTPVPSSPAPHNPRHTSRVSAAQSSHTNPRDKRSPCCTHQQRSWSTSQATTTTVTKTSEVSIETTPKLTLFPRESAALYMLMYNGTSTLPLSINARLKKGGESMNVK